MSSEMYTVVSTMKNEGPYIIDWVAHYKTLGFDHILVCTNDCTDTTVEILLRLQELGLVTHHPTIVRQAGIHRSALRQASRRYDIVIDAKWVFVCDVDEYLNIHMGDGSVQALVAGSGPDADVISVPWRIFGPNGIEGIEDMPVTEQFTMGEYEWDEKERPTTGKFVKSIYTNQYKFQRMGLHSPVSLDEHVSDTKRVLPGGADYVRDGVRTENPPLFTHAQLNHYALRSMDSFLVKRARGRANHSHHVLGKKYWEKFNLNDEVDTSISRYAAASGKLAAELKSDPILADLHKRSVDWHLRKAASLKMDPDMDELIDHLKSDIGVQNVRHYG
ncbi:glycosyltransferase family 2 protein [Sulfitobacter sp. F26204]|uniref:glycosyltransferase family 2 protein n=1 Tax=Sulfitobacter sp. F26204 TaxID=2996014 RepID=UPI00225E276A|nr:glycosyltransferase family 2 protein [Sulfitobacter sp. F26204]MCX7560665.1 glycosyltransferase family 2 protein [Sulfitobacter sp. F26204]